MFCCKLLYVHFTFVIILMGKRELASLLSLSSWCLVMVVWLFLAVPWVCLRFVIVVFPLTHLLCLVRVQPSMSFIIQISHSMAHACTKLSLYFLFFQNILALNPRVSKHASLVSSSQTKQNKKHWKRNSTKGCSVSLRINSLPTGIFPAFLSSADVFRNHIFRHILSEIQLECQTVWIHIRPDVLSGLIWVQNVFKSYQQTKYLCHGLSSCTSCTWRLGALWLNGRVLDDALIH